METLSALELHQLAMNHVGKDLEAKGFEFIAINSQLKKHPQFVCVDKPTNTLHFVLVQVATYPNHPQQYDVVWMETFKAHAEKLKAKVLFAGVGIANANDVEKPIYKTDDYAIFYEGYVEIS
ncbi:MAG: Na(+)-translocating NADH-quinone reductase subunit F [Flavobacteriales bacterium]|nr:Na(+)-translocating NADH-quinone reductase subunit F [Flavobacteriales bacterium]